MQGPRSFYPESLPEPGASAPPPSSNSLRMPNVVVTPPEEEQAQTPPFLYFDASKARSMSTAPDLETLSIALDVHRQIQNTAPVFQRANFSEETIVMPKRGGRKTVVPRKERLSPVAQERDIDDDVVEVIKVRKHEGISDTSAGKAPTMARSKTFKARATQAFRSIKSVGKSGRRSALHKASSSVDRIENIYVQPSSDETASTNRTSSRRVTRPLSQIFQFGQEWDECGRAIDIESRSSTPLQSPPSPTRSARSLSRPPSAASYYTMPGSFSSGPDDARQFSLGSSKHIKRARSFRQRLSLLELPRLFTSSSISSTNSSNSQTSIPSPPTPSKDTPEPEIGFPESSSVSDDQSASQNWMMSDNSCPADQDEDDDYGELQAPSLSMVREEDSRWDDVSLEMRLDSLHFDSLSFDPDNFTMTSFIDGHVNTGRTVIV